MIKKQIFKKQKKMAIRKSINREIIVETKQEVLAEQKAVYPTPEELKKLSNAKANYINGLEKRRELKSKG